MSFVQKTKRDYYNSLVHIADKNHFRKKSNLVFPIKTLTLKRSGLDKRFNTRKE